MAVGDIYKEEKANDVCISPLLIQMRQIVIRVKAEWGKPGLQCHFTHLFSAVQCGCKYAEIEI